MQTQLMTQRRSSFGGAACLTALFCTGCAEPATNSAVLTADLPLHLEDHLDVATIEGSEVPADAPSATEWRFDEPGSWTWARPDVNSSGFYKLAETLTKGLEVVAA